MPPARTSRPIAGPRNNSSHTDRLDERQQGLQKLKSSLRQTKRLLAKDNLDATVRLTTERRLVALQKQIGEVELHKKERDFTVKYRMVKFFDRKKSCRKISHLKKLLAQDSPHNERDRLTQELMERRIDLNYISHYPKTEKYISLYPNANDHASTGHVAQSDKSETDKKRESMRQKIKERMKAGEISQEPELNLLEIGEYAQPLTEESHPSEQQRDHKDKRKTEGKKMVKGGLHNDQKGEKKISGIQAVEDDDFFGDD